MRVLLCSTLLALVALPALASRLPPPERPALCAQAELVVIAEVTGAESSWTGSAVLPVQTHWDLFVDQVLRGELDGDQARLRTLGGTVGELSWTPSEEAELAVDRRYLLLLERGPEGSWALVWGADAAIPLRHGEQGPGEALDVALASLGDCRG